MNNKIMSLKLLLLMFMITGIADGQVVTDKTEIKRRISVFKYYLDDNDSIYKSGMKMGLRDMEINIDKGKIRRRRMIKISLSGSIANDFGTINVFANNVLVNTTNMLSDIQIFSAKFQNGKLLISKVFCRTDNQGRFKLKGRMPLDENLYFRNDGRIIYYLNTKF